MERDTGLNSEYHKNKWGFIAKEEVRGSLVDGKLRRRDITGREFLLNSPNKIPAADRPEPSDIKDGGIFSKLT